MRHRREVKRLLYKQKQTNKQTKKQKGRDDAQERGEKMFAQTNKNQRNKNKKNEGIRHRRECFVFF